MTDLMIKYENVSTNLLICNLEILSSFELHQYWVKSIMRKIDKKMLKRHFVGL